MQNGQNDGNFIKFCDSQNAFGRRISVRDAFRSISCEKVKILCKSRPKFSRSSRLFFIFCKSRRLFYDGWWNPRFLCQKKTEGKTRLRNAKFCSFLHFSRRINIIHAFKAKKVTFREGNHAKVGGLCVLHSSAAKKPSRFFRFLLEFSWNLAQTNAFTVILLDGNLAKQSRISPFHFYL